MNSKSLLLFLFLLLIPQVAFSVTDSQQAFNEAIEYKNEGDLEAAEKMFRELVQFEPGNASAHFELASVYALQHDQYFQIGNDEMARAKLVQAAAELEQVTMLTPDFIPGYFNLGVVNKKLERYSEAREAFKKVRELAPYDINAIMQIGMTYEDQGFYDEAETVYNEARELQPMNPDVQNSLIALDRSREEDRQRSLRTPLSGLNPYQNANSQFFQNTNNAPQSGSVMQAAPMLGQMLLQQMMGKKQSDDGTQ